MANVKISQLPVASTLTGAELVPVVQTGVTTQSTIGQIVDAVATTVHTNPAKTALADADVLALSDSEASWDLAGASWGTVKTEMQSEMQFLQSGAGALPRGNQNKLQDWVSIKDFGAVSGGAAATNRAAIQAAVDAMPLGGTVYIPRGTYHINAEIVTTAGPIIFRGESRDASRIYQTTLNAKVLRITTAMSGIAALSVGYTGGTPTIGATAVQVSAGYVTLQDFFIPSSHIGVSWVTGAVAGKMINFEMFNYESSGITVDAANDIFISNFIMNAGNTTRGALGGIRLLNKAEAIIITDGDILLGVYPLTMDATTYGIGSRPAYNRFTNVYFDSAENGAFISKCVETDFVGCWFSNGRSGAGTVGAVLSNCEAVRFTNTTFFNCGSHGVSVTSTAIDTVFVNCNADSNSVTTGAGVSHGFNFGVNTTNFKLIGCTASNGLFTGTQGYGISIGAGCSDFVISNCTLIGNATGPILDGSGASVAKFITGNIGVTTSNVTGSTSFGKATVPTVAVDTTSFGTNLVTNTAATYTVLSTDHTIVQTTAASVYTLPAAASFTGRRLHLLTQFAGTVTSASSNVVPIAGGAAGTAILAATAGKYALLQSNGTNWLIVAAN